MRVDDLLDAVGGINPQYVTEAETYRKKPGLQRNRMLTGFAAAACLGLFVTGGIYGLMDTREDENQIAGGMMESAEDGAMQAQKGSGAGEETSDKIVIHEIAGIRSVFYDAEEPDHVDFYDVKGLENYFGAGILPDHLPEDLILVSAEEEIYQASYNKEGRVTDDNNELCFENGAGERELKIAVRTVDAGEVITFDDPGLEASVVKGMQVLIGHYYTDAGQAECYLAEFEEGGVKFTVQSKNLSQQEFLSILKGMKP